MPISRAERKGPRTFCRSQVESAAPPPMASARASRPEGAARSAAYAKAFTCAKATNPGPVTFQCTLFTWCHPLSLRGQQC